MIDMNRRITEFRVGDQAPRKVHEDYIIMHCVYLRRGCCAAIHPMIYVQLQVLGLS